MTVKSNFPDDEREQSFDPKLFFIIIGSMLENDTNNYRKKTRGISSLQTRYERSPKIEFSRLIILNLRYTGQAVGRLLQIINISEM